MGLRFGRLVKVESEQLRDTNYSVLPMKFVSTTSLYA